MDNISGNKRGISPLIATVLLIAFAVALGTVVMQMAPKVVSPANMTVRCEETFVDFFVFPDKTPDLCFSGSELIMTIKAFNSKLDGIKVNINGERGTDSQDFFFEKPIKDGDLGKVIIPFDAKNGKINAVEIFPILGQQENPTYCKSNSLVVSQIRLC